MNIVKIFQSRTNLTIVGLFLINGIEGVKEFFQPEALPLVNAVLGLLAVYFRVNTRIDFKK